MDVYKEFLDHKIDIYQLLEAIRLERDLTRNIETSPSLAEMIEVIYEAEWKNFALNHNLNRERQGPKAKRIRNIKQRLERKVHPVIEEVADMIAGVFNSWLRQHSFDPEVWARSRLEGDVFLIEDFSRPSSEFDEFISIIEGFAGARQGATDNAANIDVEGGITEYLNENGITMELREFFIQQINRIEDEEQREDFNNLLRNREFSELFSIFPMDPFIITVGDFEQVTGIDPLRFAEFLLRTQLFDAWRRLWGDDIKSVKETVDERTKKLETIKPSNLAESFKRINLALNTAHVNGSMVEWIQRQHPDVTLGLLDEVSEGPKPQWIEDVEEAGLVVPPTQN